MVAPEAGKPQGDHAVGEEGRPRDAQLVLAAGPEAFEFLLGAFLRPKDRRALPRKARAKPGQLGLSMGGAVKAVKDDKAAK